MLKKAFNAYLKISKLVPSIVQQRFNYNLNILLMADVICRILKLTMQKAELRAAYIGNQPDILGLTESLHDLGFTHTEGCFFETDRDDIMHPTRPLSHFNPDGYDVAFVGDNNVHKENEIVQDLVSNDKFENAHCKAIQLRILAEKHVSTLRKLNFRYVKTCLNNYKLAMVGALVHMTPRTGCVVEAGVYMGGTTIYIAKLQEELGINRPIYSLDTFEGMPKPTEKDFGGNFVYKEKMFEDGTLEVVKSYYAKSKVTNCIEVLPGFCENTIIAVLDKEKYISLMLLDTDQYAGTRGGLHHGIPALNTNGVIIVDDTTVHGVNMAIEEEVSFFINSKRINILHNFDIVCHKMDNKCFSSIA